MRPSIIEMYEAGFSLRKIESITGIPFTTVRDRLKAYGVPMRSRGGGQGRLDHAGCARAAFLYERMGWSVTEIKDELGLKSHSAVVNRLQHHGVRLRDRSESLRLRFARRPKAA